MLTTIGDVLAYAGILLLISLSAWATMLGLSLVFPGKTELAQARIESRGWRCFLTGLAVTIVGTTLGIILLNIDNGLIRLVGFLLLSGLFAIGGIGASGLALLVAHRLRALDPELGPYAALSRGALLIISASWAPVFGWFFLTPSVLLVSVGAGWMSLVVRSPATSIALEA